MNQIRARLTLRAAVAAVMGVVLAMGVLVGPGPQAPAPVGAQEAAAPDEAATRWLAEEHRWHTDAFNASTTVGSDALLAWAATGTEYTAAESVRDALVASATTTLTLEANARVLLALATYGEDPTDIGGDDLDASLRAFLFTDGVNIGRFKTSRTGSSPNNTVILQARGMLALAKTTGGIPAASTTALASTQCADGSYPTTWASATCANLEATALAAQALRAGGNTADAAEAEAWIASVQTGIGSFTATNGANAELVGLAAQTLRAAGNTAAADSAAAYITGLQLGPDDGVWDHDEGAIAQNPDRRADAVAAGEIPLGLRMNNFRTPTLRAVLALGAPAYVALTPPPESEPPPEPVRWSPGACVGTEGVTVVIDFVALVDRIDVRCALGNQISGWAALVNAGYPVASVPGFPGSAVCQIDGEPTAGYPTCWNTGFWSYYQAPSTEPGSAWAFSSGGYSTTKPAAGSVEGSRYVADFSTDPGGPPRLGPVFPAPTVEITAGPDDPTTDTSASFTFTSSDEDATTTCALDGADPEPCTSAHELTDLEPGDHTLVVTATSSPSLRQGSDTYGWTVLGAAECTAVPRAPTFDIIDADEDLTFTIADGHPIEHAVLTDLDADPAEATFTAGATVDLDAHQGDTVRIVARRAGTSCPEGDLFDSVYDVRAAYAPAWNAASGTAGGPSPAVAATSSAIVGWATGHSEYTPGPNVNTGFKVPENAYGPIDASLVVLGDHGTITMTFGAPITDGAGYDLAVFENGFASGPAGYGFLELGYVEVSSNGTDFVRFDSASRRADAVGGFTTQDPAELGGLAGKDLSGRGTPFDLALLANRPEVRDGDIDLSAITHVRVRDVHGAGEAPSEDFFGRVIHDPTPTTGSGGYDLTGIGVLNQVDLVDPVVEITSAPSGAVSSTTAEVEFTVDDGSATVESRIDEGDWTAATSPLTFDDLEEGEHTVEVRATDGAGNVGSDSAMWSVDTTDPVVEITSGPPAVTNESTATIAYSVDDPDATVEYRVNDGDWIVTEASPIGLVDLYDEAYTVEVRATDDAGNVGSDSIGWSIDVSAPELRITVAPDTPSKSRSGTMEFDVGDDATVVECRATESAAWATCTSPWTGTVAADGDHVMSVRARDAVGNEIQADALWTVDTVAPDVSVIDGPDAITPETTATFTYDITDWTGVTFVDCRIDGGEWAGCQDPIEYTGLAVGEHTFEIRAADLARNEGFDAFVWVVRAVRSVDEAWVWAAYEDFLDREPSSSEVSAAVGRLGGGTPRSTLARELATSEEWLSVIVTRFYVDTLGREPSVGEVGYWTGELGSGRRTVATVAASFYGSVEYVARAGGSDAAWIGDLYDALLGRSATPGDVTYWSGQVAARGRGWVALQMFQSLESRRARVEGLYQDLLGRSADAGGRDYWAGRLTGEGDIALARQLASSTEYLTRAQTRHP